MCLLHKSFIYFSIVSQVSWVFIPESLAFQSILPCSILNVLGYIPVSLPSGQRTPNDWGVTYPTSADRGGGQGVWTPPPPLCHDVGFLTLGPKLDCPVWPPFFACRPNLDPPPPPSKILDPPLPEDTAISGCYKEMWRAESALLPLWAGYLWTPAKRRLFCSKRLLIGLKV